MTRFTIPTKYLPKPLRNLSGKRTASLSLYREGATLALANTWWDGGTRHEYRLYSPLIDTVANPLSTPSSPFAVNADNLAFQLNGPQATAYHTLVETGTFCGKPMRMDLSLSARTLVCLAARCGGPRMAVAHDWTTLLTKVVQNDGEDLIDAPVNAYIDQCIEHDLPLLAICLKRITGMLPWPDGKLTLVG